jgi:hypothetical protein
MWEEFYEANDERYPGWWACFGLQILYHHNQCIIMSDQSERLVCLDRPWNEAEDRLIYAVDSKPCIILKEKLALSWMARKACHHGCVCALSY